MGTDLSATGKARRRDRFDAPVASDRTAKSSHLVARLAALCVLVLVSTAAAGGGFPVTVTDAFGRTVTIPRPPERIISIAPSVTEILFALGLDDRIVGISSVDDYPLERLSGRFRVGGLQLDIERIITLRPDLILGLPSLQAGQLQRLIAMHLPVVAVDASSLAQVFVQIETIGALTGRPEAARTLVGRLQLRQRQVAAAVAGRVRPRVYVEIWGEPLIAAASGTFIDDLIRWAGGTNIFAGLRGWPQVSAEAVLRRDPQVIVLAHPGRGQVLGRPGWLTVSAVRTGRVVSVETALISRPGPRLIEGLERIARILHPEVFR